MSKDNGFVIILKAVAFVVGAISAVYVFCTYFSSKDEKNHKPVIQIEEKEQ